jgi:hypothetical protein
MDILKQSESFAARISNVGEQFRLNLLMGELAYSTFDDFFELADVIQASIDLWEAEGKNEEEIAQLLRADSQVQLAIEQVFARMVMTADQYGYLTDEPAETAKEYCAAVGKALKDLEVICHDLGLEKLYQEQLGYYGNGARHHLDFAAHLENIYRRRLASPRAQYHPGGARRMKTADYSDALTPREYVARAIFNAEPTVATTKTLLGVSGANAAANNQNTSDPHMPLVRVSEQPVDVSVRLPLRHDTDIGLGALASQLAFGKSPAIPPHQPLPEIEEQHPTHFDDLAETTVVSEPEIAPEDIPTIPPAPAQQEPSAALTAAAETAAEEIPPMPPAPAQLEPSATMAAAAEIASMRPSRPPAAFIESPEDSPSLESSLIEAAASLSGQTVDNEQISSPQTAVPEVPAAPQIEVFVTSAEKDNGPRSTAPTVPAKEDSVVRTGSLPAEPAGKRVVLEPIAPPADLALPSSYRPGPSRPEVIREDQAIIRPQTGSSPAAVRKKTRSGLWKWAAAAAAAAGVAGLFGGVFADRDGDNDSQESRPTTAASVTPGSSGGASAGEQANQKSGPSTEKQQENQTEKGIYRVNDSHQAFADYLCYMKEATGLVSVLKSAAKSARVHYFSDSAEREQAKGRYSHVLSGSESEQQQRIIVMKALIDVAQEKSADNLWLAGYFKKHRQAIEQYEQTGKWTHSALTIGTDKLFAAIQAPEKLTTTPNIIGYAPDVNPSSNPAMLKIKAGAPTFYQILHEVGSKMQTATDASELSPYDDFRSIKDITCQKVLAAGRASKDKDTRAGISYMHRHWCADECSANNPLNRAMHAPAIPVRAEQPVKSPVKQQELHSPAPQPSVPPAAPAPQHTRLEKQSPWIGTPAEPAPQKVGFFGKALSGVKNFFGLGKKEQSESQVAVAPQPKPEPEFSKKDLPMYTWKETLKQYFWG